MKALGRMNADAVLRGMNSYAQASNLFFLLRLHYKMLRLLEQEANSSLYESHAHAANLSLSRHEHREHIEILHCQTFPLLYSHTEEWLFHLTCRKRSDSRATTGLARFREGLSSLGVEADKSPHWQLLKDAEKIRNCILHANRRLSLMKEGKRQELARVIERYSPNLSVIEDRVVVGDPFLRSFTSKVTEFLDPLLTSNAETGSADTSDA